MEQIPLTYEPAKGWQDWKHVLRNMAWYVGISCIFIPVALYLLNHVGQLNARGVLWAVSGEKGIMFILNLWLLWGFVVFVDGCLRGQLIRGVLNGIVACAIFSGSLFIGGCLLLIYRT